jgi:hypothetical protein
MSRKKPDKPRLIEDKDLDQSGGGVFLKIKAVDDPRPAGSPTGRTPGKINLND